MKRKLPVALAGAALVAAIVLWLTARGVKAIESCRGGFYQLDAADHSVVVYGEYSGVDFEERPTYLYVSWGDGTSDYRESQEWPTAYLPASHSYASFGTYDAYVEFGSVGGGYCGSNTLFIYAP